jgi:GNAT superfamily N-acetyltransferase
MNAKFRQYNVKTDFQKVGDFLNENYQPGNRDGNFLQPAWEYMHSHPMLDEKSLDRIAVWEDAGRIVAVAHHESTLGEAFFELRPGYNYLKPEMLEYAENNFCGKTPDGKTYLKAFVSDRDKEFEALVKSRGYKVETDYRLHRPVTQLKITPFRTAVLPEGFTLKSLADDNNLAQITRVFWRGFNHGDEPPSDDIAGRKKMQSVPGYRKDLNMVVVAPDGNYVSYAGLWFEPTNKYAYVEPVCTDPDYQRKGFASTAIFEGVRRCGELGATVAYVGSTQSLYQSMGFKLLFTFHCWIKFFS